MSFTVIVLVGVDTKSSFWKGAQRVSDSEKSEEILVRVRERVERGGAWLDKNRPGWFYTIDLNNLDLSCGKNCVLGQLWSIELEDEVLTCGYTRVTADKPLGWAKDHGFDTDKDIDWEELDETWISYIKERVNA